mmetsp:Transcript_21839/g.43757  ORF Transcript_21839/g.43757 Transcript_21839/m.43757 type:complete len:579 (+) Transcript_21839:151-1887(+)
MSEAAAAGGDWRKSIAQSYRSGQVRSIAEELATFEPGASADSKKMLAMKFEDSIFKAASSMDDYRKIIDKKINKLKKHYAKKGGVDEENKDLIREKELLFQKAIRDEYSAKLIYIAKHADRAVQVTRMTSGEQKAKVLKDHCDSLKKRALQLGVQIEGEAPLPRLNHGMAFLTQLKASLDTIVDTVRSHVVKVEDANLFLEEQLDSADKKLLNSKNSNILRKALQDAADADNSTQQLTTDQMKLLTDLMNVPTPIPRRNQNADQVRAALSRIEKMRASTQAILTYCGLTAEEKTSFPGSLKKCSAILKENLLALGKDHSYLFEDVEEKDEDGNPIIKLEDAWNKHLQYADETVVQSAAAVEDDDITAEDEPANKRQKTDEDTSTPPAETNRMVISARVLLTPGRKPISKLIPELKKKSAVLIKNGTVSSIRMEFGTAFEMTIYFKPLLVTIRALNKEATATTAPIRDITALSGGIQWPSLHQGLNAGEITDNNTSHVSVLGVTGTRATLAPIIAKQLEYASAQATHVLRKCFAATVNGKTSSSESDFGIEIAETSALIKFMKIVRSTYHNGKWVDVED